jgi:hypothetical protein
MLLNISQNIFFTYLSILTTSKFIRLFIEKRFQIKNSSIRRKGRKSKVNDDDDDDDINKNQNTTVMMTIMVKKRLQHFNSNLESIFKSQNRK